MSSIAYVLNAYHIGGHGFGHEDYKDERLGEFMVWNCSGQTSLWWDSRCPCSSAMNMQVWEPDFFLNLINPICLRDWILVCLGHQLIHKDS